MGVATSTCHSGQPCAGVLELRDAMASLQSKLHAKESEIAALARVRSDVDAELEELTASLFEEAHKMVRAANEARAAAEKAQKESQMKVDGLETEVEALKALVLTSTPSQPNRHLHPQLAEVDGGQKSPSKKGARRSLLGGKKRGSSESVASVGSSALANGSHYYTALDASMSTHSSPSASLSSEDQNLACSSPCGSSSAREAATAGMDPTLRRDFLAWRRSPTLDEEKSPFVALIMTEDVRPCLRFPDEELSQRVAAAVRENALAMAPVRDLTGVPRDCALMRQPVMCRYTLTLSPQSEETFYICQLTRNRLAAACDLLGYLRYVERGLVKASSNDVYWEVQRLRREIAAARLGY